MGEFDAMKKTLTYAELREMIKNMPEGKCVICGSKTTHVRFDGKQTGSEGMFVCDYNESPQCMHTWHDRYGFHSPGPRFRRG